MAGGLPKFLMVYGGRRDEAIARVKALALRVLADKLERSISKGYV